MYRRVWLEQERVERRVCTDQSRRCRRGARAGGGYKVLYSINPITEPDKRTEYKPGECIPPLPPPGCTFTCHAHPLTADSETTIYAKMRKKIP